MNKNYRIFLKSILALGVVLLFCEIRSKNSDIHQDLAAAVIDEIDESLTINYENLDSVTPLAIKTIKTLHNHSLGDIFHYIRELKNTLKRGSKISCKSASAIIFEILLLWKKNKLENSNLFELSENKLSDMFVDFAIDNIKMIKKEPDIFFHNLAQKTFNELNKKEIDITPKRLGLEIYLLAEILLGKLIWSVADEDLFWDESWNLLNQIDNFAKYEIVDEDDYYKDLFSSFKTSLINFLNFSETKEENSKNGYKLSNSFFSRGTTFLNNELIGFANNLVWLKEELTTWITKRSVANSPSTSKKSKLLIGMKK